MIGTPGTDRRPFPKDTVGAPSFHEASSWFFSFEGKGGIDCRRWGPSEFRLREMADHAEFVLGQALKILFREPPFLDEDPKNLGEN
jgi:hypothetical protein